MAHVGNTFAPWWDLWSFYVLKYDSFSYLDTQNNQLVINTNNNNWLKVSIQIYIHTHTHCHYCTVLSRMLVFFETYYRTFCILLLNEMNRRFWAFPSKSLNLACIGDHRQCRSFGSHVYHSRLVAWLLIHSYSYTYEL